ncbi:MAG TPA: hypothetical protein VHB21_19650 [Minicystis sp.]|nr:hypothetical protein [Minicystis sp.]
MHRLACLSLVLVASVGCAAGSSSSSSTFGGGGGSGGSGAGLGSGGSSAGSSAGGFDPTGSGGGQGGAVGPAEVFAEGPNTLYKLDPDTKAVTEVGPFTGCDGGVIDLAVDKDGVMYATTTDALYRVDKTTGACTLLANGNYPNSLSLVPVGTVDPNDEALVGFNGSDYVRIDKTTGAVTSIGTLTGGYTSSGDVVSVIGGGTYLTVKGNGCNDCIVEVDPTTGALVQMIGALDHKSVFGLAFWGGTAYGFDDFGKLFAIDLTNATTTPIQTGLMVPQFWGAGSTTAAPLNPK